MNKKRIFAIVVFIILGLFMYTFANPANDESNNNNANQPTSSTDTNDNNDSRFLQTVVPNVFNYIHEQEGTEFMIKN